MEQKNKNMDDFIRSVFNEDAPIPAGFEWEEMNIEIPKKKQSSKRLIFLLIFLGVFISGALLYRNNPLSTQAITDQPINTLPASSKNLTDENTNKKAAIITQQIVKNDNRNDNIVVEGAALFAHLSKPSIDIPSINNKTTISKQFSEVFAENTKEEQINHSIASVEYYPERKLVDEIEALSLLTLAQISSINQPSFELAVAPISNKVLSVEEDQIKPIEGALAQSGKKNLGLDLFFLVGTNIPEFKIAADNQLKDKIGRATGLAVELGVQKRFANSLDLFLSFNYYKLHTTFENERFLGTTDDYDRMVRISQYEETYHNNFAKVLSLNIGVAKSLIRFSNFEGAIGVSIAPTYFIESTGKSVIDDSPVTYLDDSAWTGVSVSLSPLLETRWKLSQRLNILAQYQLNYFIGKDVFLNTEIFSSSNHQLKAGFSWEF